LTDLRDQLQVSLGDAYTIERELGGGGMSRVFVAVEASLGRRVVVKVLPAELAGGVSIARFRREISLAARLQHPHIVPLLAAGEIEGLPYYTMPFVDGESLRSRLAHGELPVAETISVLRDVARALEYAHGKGVAHRDIKPDNVLLAGTSAVITDFGVAKAISDATASGSLTSAGIALGTAAYMAPEQAAGDPGTDVRADIYAFGAMAYEMLAGHTPFAGRSAQATLAAHATETPPAIAAVRPATPPALAALVTRCLEKRAGDRPQSASEIVRALDTVVTTAGPLVPRESLGAPLSAVVPGARTLLVAVGVAGAMLALVALMIWTRGPSGFSGSKIRSIAVLPFENKSGDTTFDYLEDGITDHVRDALNAMPALTVKARSSSQALRGRDARDVGARLDVGAVLQGTVSGSGTHLKVTAELVRAADDNTIWSGTFDGRPNELAEVQDTILRAIAAKLGLRRSTTPARALAVRGGRGTDDAEAYSLLLRGRYALDRQDFVRAEALFREALARDPRFARARGYLAGARAGLPLFGVGPLDSIDALARVDAREALALDSTVVEAYIAESNLAGNEMRLGEQLPPLERALAIDSTNVDVIIAYALALSSVGRIPEALVSARGARDRDPLSVTAVAIEGGFLGWLGRYDDGLARLRAALDLDPNAVIVRRTIGFFYAFSGKPDSSVATLEAAYRLNPTMFGGRSNLIFGYAAAGRWNDATRERALLDREHSGNSVNYEQMIAAIAFGEYDKAMALLERSIAAREPLLWITSLPCDPTFDPLKSDPRFVPLMQRLGAAACPATAKWPIGRPQ